MLVAIVSVSSLFISEGIWKIVETLSLNLVCVYFTVVNGIIEFEGCSDQEKTG